MARAYGSHYLLSDSFGRNKFHPIKSSEPTALIGGSSGGTVLYCSFGFQSGEKEMRMNRGVVSTNHILFH